ncbi:hypothetical protein HDU98_006048, partial [Podochytrium sp. JEL0797]
MEGAGIIYAINVNCANPQPYSGPPSKEFVMHVELANEEDWKDYYNTAVYVRYPAKSHTVREWFHQDIVQKCQLQLVTGSGVASYNYISDEWGN